LGCPRAPSSTLFPYTTLFRSLPRWRAVCSSVTVVTCSPVTPGCIVIMVWLAFYTLSIRRIAIGEKDHAQLVLQRPDLLDLLVGEVGQGHARLHGKNAHVLHLRLQLAHALQAGFVQVGERKLGPVFHGNLSTRLAYSRS